MPRPRAERSATAPGNDALEDLRWWVLTSDHLKHSPTAGARRSPPKARSATLQTGGPYASRAVTLGTFGVLSGSGSGLRADSQGLTPASPRASSASGFKEPNPAKQRAVRSPRCASTSGASEMAGRAGSASHATPLRAGSPSRGVHRWERIGRQVGRRTCAVRRQALAAFSTTARRTRPSRAPCGASPSVAAMDG